MLLQARLLCALAAVATLAACGASYPLQPVENDGPREAMVSARQAIPSRTRPAAALALRAVEPQVSLTWTEGAERYLATSDDGGRTFAPPVSPSSEESSPVPQPVFELSFVREREWSVHPRAGAFSDVEWTAEAGNAAAHPFAIQEFCGLVSVVAVEQAEAQKRLVLRRYLPPRQASARAAQRIGSLVDLGAAQSHMGSIVAIPLAESVIVAWADTKAVNVVRVELPDVLCAGTVLRPRS